MSEQPDHIEVKLSYKSKSFKPPGKHTYEDVRNFIIRHLTVEYGCQVDAQIIYRKVEL